MRYLSLFTPNPEDMGKPPTPEHMQRMNAMMEEMKKSGRLIATGALKFADKDSINISLKGGDFKIDESGKSDWRKSMGYALLQGETKQDIIDGTKHFLDVCGGGTCELIEITG